MKAVSTAKYTGARVRREREATGNTKIGQSRLQERISLIAACCKQVRSRSHRTAPNVTATGECEGVREGEGEGLPTTGNGH